jgi:predicted methyltransferase
MRSHLVSLPRRVLALALLLGGCASTGAPATTSSSAPAPDNARAIVDAPDRSDDDRKNDAFRKPVELLAFVGVRPGWKLADLGAGEGYSTELFVRAAGPTGVVYAQNSPYMMKKFFEDKWSERFDKPLMKPVVRVKQEFDDPLPPTAKELDAVVLALFYHDTVWLEADRKKMNAAIFRGLRAGGVYVVIDHSAKDGAGVSVASDLHRIEEKVVREEVLAAGFKLAGESAFLRNPEDARDFNVIDDGKQGKSDRFALRFVKP